MAGNKGVVEKKNCINSVYGCSGFKWDNVDILKLRNDNRMAKDVVIMSWT